MRRSEPIFSADPANPWEAHKVTACQVIPSADGFLMFFIGFENEHLARIGIARSKDGLTHWERMPENPIIGPAPFFAWDASACYKPFAIFDAQADLWRLWFNGRNGNVEQIGLVTHSGKEIW